MLPNSHAIYGALFTMIVIILFPELSLFYILILFLSTVFIDIDHYLTYIWRKKDLNLHRFFNYFKNNQKIEKYLKQGKKVKCPLVIFHTIEFLFIIFILALFNKIFLIIFIGFMFHSLLDIIHIYRKFNTLQPRIFSLILLIFKKNKNIKYL